MKKVLLVTIGFSPNIGGIETHFDDLTFLLDKKGFKVWVLTYKPITTDISAPFFEKRGKNIFIYRIPCLRGIFYKFLKYPFLEFLFLLPGLFFTFPLVFLIKAIDVDVIHTHGLVAGFVGVFWGKIFGKKVLATTHSIYNFPPKGLYRSFAKWIFENSDTVLTLSKQSKTEIQNLGIPRKKIKVFTYWIDLKKFQIPNSKFQIRKKLGWEGKFVVLFVGRLVKEKGVLELLEAAKKWNDNITLAIAGSGPLEGEIKNQKSKIKNLIYLGRVNNDKLPPYYSASDLVIVPSTHEEGFGRVILEALACGTPVIGAKRGAIPEAMDDTVGKLINPTPEEIKRAVEFFYENKKDLQKRARNARKFAEKRYSERNIEAIIEEYEGKS